MTITKENRLNQTDVLDQDVQDSAKTNWQRLFGLQEMGVYYALLLLIVTLTIITTYLGQSNYLSVQNLSNVVYQSSLIAIMAVAMTVVLISGNFDLSVASVAALAAVMLIGNADAIGFWPAAALAVIVAMSRLVHAKLHNGWPPRLCGRWQFRGGPLVRYQRHEIQVDGFRLL
ncbi:hypothetical protein [Mesorhizobium sp.]|uniref:hypothetical protein n=1 Tax=Mesorhizobium sp. TaxID=1871066 RepID=UPI0025FD5DC7|nr:hypothetical protein [Mesorhizobium sp.]